MHPAARHLEHALACLRLEATLALAEQTGRPREDRERLEGELARARRHEEETRAAAGETLPLARLVERLALRPLDEAFLLAAVALEVDPVLALTATALLGDEPRQGISPRLFTQMLRLEAAQALGLRVDVSHPLVASGLLEPAPVAPVPDALRPFRASARLLSFLAGIDELDPMLRRAGEVTRVPADADLAHAEGAREFLERALSSGQDVVLVIEGPDGIGRRTIAAAAAEDAGRTVVAVDAGALSAERPRFLAELAALRRECWLRDAVPVLARVDTLSRRDGLAARLADLAEFVDGVPGPVIITQVPGGELPGFRRRVARLRMGAPGPTARARIWARALGGEDKIADEEVAAVVHHFALAPGGILRAAENARLLAGTDAPTAEHIRAGVSAEVEERFSGLAVRADVVQTWDDLVLPADTNDDVRAFASRAEHAALVYDRWGFREKLGRGLGLSALFSGPPGTGKTMVAGLIAKSLGLELYQVDLSQVVSKWVGETEKQLGKIFDAAAMGHVVLLFDEADALFAKRTEVKSSNDRYANLEVNYLLQRLENYPGVAILTTNLDASIDPAFKRRLAAEVRFYPPEREERIRLWRTHFPPGAPAEEELDFAVLADSFKEMCGGHIRNAVLRAAFLAAAEGGRINQGHLRRAAVIEYRAMGKVV